MVLGVVAGLGLGLAGIGIFKGSRDAGRGAKKAGGGVERAGIAAERAAHSFDEFRKEAEQALKNISTEVKMIRQFLTTEVWPKMNQTLTGVQNVLDRADTFLVSSNFTVKVLALLLAICAAYMIHKLILSSNAASRRQKGKSTANSVSSAIENTILNIVYWLCLVLALGLVLHLVRELLSIFWPHLLQRIKELLNTWWPDSIPRIIIIIIPSLTILYDHLIVTMNVLLRLFRLIPYVLIELPINKGVDPVRKGSRYMETINVPLQLIFCVIYLALYSFIPYISYCLIEYLARSESSIIKRILIAYGVFFSATVVISYLGGLIISVLIRPIWAFWARRNLNRNCYN